MKIGVLADTHVPVVAQALPPVIFDIFHGVDLILHAGDLVELSVLDELRAIAPVEAVAGNMDNAEAHLKLPAQKIIPVNGYTIGLIHGAYRIDSQRNMIRKKFGKVDLIVYGHSHTPFWGREEGTFFLNPGSPTDQRHAPYCSIALLEVGDELHAEIIKI